MPSTCPRCGQPLPSDAPAGLCAACLLAAGAETLTTSGTDHLPTVSSGVGPPDGTQGPRLEAGTQWGPYRIGRLLGRGGMGEVFEAEQLASGRRVALKVLRSRLERPDERARFLREGQLAASVSHPHTVYIFGSEEIDGSPVISMELLPGGTLKDLVAAGGPMRPSEAVAAILDVVGGLDAAAAVGILHRDIKPSNCFVDDDGTIKVGDFGLSLSTLARDVRHELSTSGFEGTPQFAPPEQLRGEPLDVRADIYAVGATLYYLLTGRAPFDAPDLRELVARVTGTPPVSPRRLQREIPARLAAVVMQCLAKTPAERPASYPALADALRPFLVRHDQPAPLGTRLLAGVIDSWIIVGLPMALLVAWISDPLSGPPGATLKVAAWTWVVNLAYYFALEGASGASLAKRMFGLRVTADDGSSPSWRQMAIRTAMLYLPNVVLVLALAGGLVAAGERLDTYRSVAMVLFSALLFFSTARRGNGWTGLHDVVSGTRVVSRHAPAVHSVSPVQRKAFPEGSASSMRRFGPFVAADGERPRSNAVVEAFDPVLRRHVWVHVATPGTPPISVVRRDVSRVSRLHWLAGRRSADEHWDAYEAPDGVPFADAGSGVERWPLLKQQLFELTTEIDRAEREGILPPLALDRLWLRTDGHLVLLDFPVPGAGGGGRRLTPEELMAAIVARVPVHEARPDSLPLSARAFLDRVSGPLAMPVHEARAALWAMMPTPNHVQRWRRAVPGALAGAPVVLMLLVAALLLPALARFASSDTSGMMNLLGALRSSTLPADNPLRRPEVRAAAEVAVAGRYAHLIRDEGFWNAGVVRALSPEYRPLAEDILGRHPNVSAGQLASAEAVLKAARDGIRVDPRAQREQGVVAVGGVIISTVTAGALALVLACCVISALLVPGGIVSRQLGLATVTRRGTEITRLRSVGRALLAGVPAMAWFLYLALAPRVQGFVPTPGSPLAATLVTVGTLALGVAWTAARRTRGPHDVLMGTWVVPR